MPRKAKSQLDSGVKIDYTPPGPIAEEFLHCNARVCGLAGPIGSGKSVASIFKIIKRSAAQVPDKEGIRRSKWCIVRNTYGDLRRTTVATWLQWFPEAQFGKMTKSPDLEHRVRFGDIDMHIIFVALDPKQMGEEAMLSKLKSLEVTGFYFNEAKYLPAELVLEANTRLGRFPPKKDKPDDVSVEEWFSQKQLILDTNMCSKRHWYYHLAALDGWATDDKGERVEVGVIPEKKRWKFYHQPSGLSPEAENLDNLDEGYYEELCRAHSKDWIDVNVHAKYGDVKDGMAVYANSYKDEIHCSRDVQYIPHSHIYVGLDFGLTPAAVIGIKTAFGQWLILEEIVLEEGDQMTIDQIAKYLLSHLSYTYPNVDYRVFGDPAGGQTLGMSKDNIKVTAFDVCRQQGLNVNPAPTNNIRMRIETVQKPLNRLIQGDPGLIISDKCVNLREGFNSGYKYKKLSLSGVDARYEDKPDKNRFSHVHDALQYLLCGGGELQSIVAQGNEIQPFVRGKYRTSA